MCYPLCGIVHIKEPLLLIRKNSLCGSSRSILHVVDPLIYFSFQPVFMKQPLLLIGKSSPCGGHNSNEPTLLQYGMEVTAVEGVTKDAILSVG